MDALDGDSGFEAGAADNPFGSAELPKPPGVGAQLKKKLTLKRNNISDVSSLVEGLKVRPAAQCQLCALCLPSSVPELGQHPAISACAHHCKRRRATRTAACRPSTWGG